MLWKDRNAEKTAKVREYCERNGLEMPDFTDSLAIFKMYCVVFANDENSGVIGNATENAIRSLLCRRHCFATKGAKDVDLCSSRFGSKKAVVEIKTACGELDDTYTADFVIYCPTIENDIPLEEQMFVFNHEEWIALLNGYTSPRGGKLIRHDNARNHDHIQSFWCESRPKASRTIADYLWSKCFEQPTLVEFLQ